MRHTTSQCSFGLVVPGNPTATLVMTSEEEARVRAAIRSDQEMAAYFEKRGSEYDGCFDPGPEFDKTEARTRSVEALQRRLEAAGKPCEPHRGRWDFKLP